MGTSGEASRRLSRTRRREVAETEFGDQLRSPARAWCRTYYSGDFERAPASTGRALVQCVQNLLSNALKYGKTSGKAQIEIATEADRSSKQVRLSITDHGPGIDPLDERHLFDAFYRGAKVESNIPGNGLGLHLV